MKTIKIHKNVYDDRLLYKKASITLEEGLTVFVGCNGIGKSTLIKECEDFLKSENISYFSYDNLTDGGETARSKACFFGDMSFLATSICSSEGENIVLNMEECAASMGKYSQKHQNQEELWFFLDAIDSGLSIDNVEDIKEYLFKTILEHNKEKKVYIIVTANAYELCRGENCFDIYNGKYIKFTDYEDYRQFILKTKDIKNKLMK